MRWVSEPLPEDAEKRLRIVFRCELGEHGCGNFENLGARIQCVRHEPARYAARCRAGLIDERLRNETVVARGNKKRRAFGDEKARFLAHLAHLERPDRFDAIVRQARYDLRRRHACWLQRTNSDVGTIGPLADRIASSPLSKLPPLPASVSRIN